jgi:hypothetical protein
MAPSNTILHCLQASTAMVLTLLGMMIVAPWQPLMYTSCSSRAPSRDTGSPATWNGEEGGGGKGKRRGVRWPDPSNAMQ